MANTIVRQVYAEFEQLQQELTRFRTAADYLNGAHAQVEEAVLTVREAEQHFDKRIMELKDVYLSFLKLSESAESLFKKIDQVDFPARLTQIGSGADEAVRQVTLIREAVVKEMASFAQQLTVADIGGHLDKLEASFEVTAKSNFELIAAVNGQQLPEKMAGLERAVCKRIEDAHQEMEKYIRKNSDELIKIISGLQLVARTDRLAQGIIDIQSRMLGIEDRIESIRQEADQHMARADAKQEELFEVLRKENEYKYKRMFTGQFILGGLILVMLILLFCK